MFTEHTSILTEPETQDIYTYFMGLQARWTFHGFSVPGDGTRLWFHDLGDVGFFSNECVDRLKLTLKNLGKLKAVYANGQTKGQHGGWHIDGDTGTTVLWYLNSLSSSEGGATEFKNGEETFFYQPKRNSLISFPSNVKHRGMAPVIDGELRVTIVWKFE